MDDQIKYVPILKSKQAEFWALHNLEEYLKNKVLPLLEITSIPRDSKTKKPKKTLKAHLDNIIQKTEKSWCGSSLFGGPPIYFDFTYLNTDKQKIEKIHSISYFFESLKYTGINGIPTISNDLSFKAMREIVDVSKKNSTELCIRLEWENMKKPTSTHKFIQKILEQSNTPEEEANLIFDLKEIPNPKIENPSSFSRSVIQNFPELMRWKSITLAASSFPKTLSDLNEESMEYLEREEFEIWDSINKSNKKILRPIRFGDYAIQHPSFSDHNFGSKDQKVNLRYTLPSSWLVYKKRGWSEYGGVQFQEICQNLIKSNDFSGASFSAGDKYILECAKGFKGTGTPTIWRKIAFNHHFALVLQQINNN